MIERYSRKEIKKIWEEKNKYQIWLDIEIAAAQGMEKYKIIPRVQTNSSEIRISIKNYKFVMKSRPGTSPALTRYYSSSTAGEVLYESLLCAAARRKALECNTSSKLST